ncbi:class II aldolase/adducin family protein [Nocardia terpenica]|uniref:Methylthioribulose-1-phosphate dehydratase n=1 Tax=Nocardia terpenica TaxID=455432 RepID=A0A291RJL8_9NOCA|nr:methylthioribulose-1-phosphate dehydratase [Nocardia terpenica]
MSRSLYRRGWMPGGFGSLSMRTPNDSDWFSITASGRDRGALTYPDVIPVWTSDGTAVGPDDRMSYEASIHAAIYRTTAAEAIIHAHTIYTMAIACDDNDNRIQQLDLGLEKYELSKALDLPSDASAYLPVFPNWADIPRIARDVEDHLAHDGNSSLPAFLIAYNGVTAWGRDLNEARRRLECIEAICHLSWANRASAATTSDGA